jgi:hypothetical protein
MISSELVAISTGLSICLSSSVINKIKRAFFCQYDRTYNHSLDDIGNILDYLLYQIIIGFSLSFMIFSMFAHVYIFLLADKSCPKISTNLLTSHYLSQ